MANTVHLALALAAILPLAGQTTRPDASAPPREPDRPVLGVAINAHHISNLPLYLESVDAIAEMGANTLLVVTPMFQERVDSSEIRLLPDRCPTDEQLLAILRRAEERELDTTLLPIVLIEQPGENDWRGLLRPADSVAWWKSYERFLDRYLAIARAGGVDAFSVGSELNSMEPLRHRWRHVIARAREAFDGALTYTANWDRFDRVTFWPWLDFISVSSYFELSPEDPDASLDTLVRAWSAERDRLVRFARRQERPLLLMELGYPTLSWAAAHPWNYVAEEGAAADHAAQARCFRAFFAAWGETIGRPGSGVLGFNCYAWDPYHGGGPIDTGYGIRGKPAYEIVRDGFERLRNRAAGANPR